MGMKPHFRFPSFQGTASMLKNPKSWFLTIVNPILREIKSEGSDRLQHRSQVLSAFADFLVLGGINEAKKMMRGVPFRNTSREHTTAVFEAFETPYAYAVWRAMCYTIRRGTHAITTKSEGVNWQKGCKRYGVDFRDAYFVWKYMTRKARTSLISFASDRTVILRPLARKHMNEMLLQLRNYAAKIANRKLRFIWNNDAGTSVDDLISELLIQGSSAIRKMEFTGNANGVRHNRLHIANYAARAIHNKAISIIEYHTSGARASVERVDVGEEGSRLPEYQRRVLSMDKRMGSHQPDSEESATFHGIIESNQGAKGILDEVFIREIRTRFQGAASLILKILMDGHVDADFEVYLEKQYKGKAAGLPPEILLREACDFFNVDHELLKKSLRRALGRKEDGTPRKRDSIIFDEPKIPTPYVQALSFSK